MNPRTLAITLLLQVIKYHKPLSQALEYHKSIHNNNINNPLDPLIPELCFGTLRWFHQLSFISQQLITKPIKNKDIEVHLLILIGLYQLIHMRIPEHAAISETVAAAKTLKQPWAANMVNAVLRNYTRSKDGIQKIIATATNRTAIAARFSHPSWFIQAMQQQWPTQWQTILEANNQRPPQTLRINQQQTTRVDYLALLQTNNIKAQAIPEIPHGIVLNPPQNTHKIPGFANGRASIQDGAAQLAAMLLSLQPNMRVLDACAAPGGKTCHILEQEPSVNCTALDISKTRCNKIVDNLTRCQLQTASKITIITADACQPNSWWDKQQFDRILLDAPCSATGIIRRQPDIKLHRTPQDITKLIATQAALLETLWPLLKPQGILLYVTCSIMAEENWQQIQRFKQQHQDCQVLPIDIDIGQSMPLGQQILPGQSNMDGFYYAKLRRKL